jgi:hypothetical protein
MLDGLSADERDQDTLPLNILPLYSATAFCAYLHRYHLHPLQVAMASGVRYFTIWNIQKGIAVRQTHAALVRQGLYKLTGVPYSAPIEVLAEENHKRRGILQSVKMERFQRS